MVNRYRLILLIIPILLTLSNCKQNTSNREPSQEEVLAILDARIHKHPNDAKLYHDRANIYLKDNRVNDAISDLMRAVDLDKKNVKYHLLLGDAYFANGDVEHSYKTIQKAIDLDPDNQEAYLKLGEIAYYSRDYDRALESLGKVTAKDPQNRTALFMKGFIYKEKGDTSNAVVLLRKVCDLYPDYAPAFEELGVLYATRRSPLAMEYLSTAHRLDPQNTNILYAIAMFYQDTRQYEQAEETYKQILDIDGNHKYAWHNRGYMEMFVHGNYPQAIEYLTRAIQCDSTFIEAYANRGCAYELQGDRDRATADFRAALNLDHTFQPAIDGLTRIN